MASWAALGGPASPPPPPTRSGQTREAREAAAIRAYEEALATHAGGKLATARELYEAVLAEPVVADARMIPGKPLRAVPAALLKFLASKNLAAVLAALAPDDPRLISAGVDHAVAALGLDDSDGLLWRLLGDLATAASNPGLARYAYEHTLEADPYDRKAVRGLASALALLEDLPALAAVDRHAAALGTPSSPPPGSKRARPSSPPPPPRHPVRDIVVAPNATHPWFDLVLALVHQLRASLTATEAGECAVPRVRFVLVPLDNPEGPAGTILDPPPSPERSPSPPPVSMPGKQPRAKPEPEPSPPLAKPGKDSDEPQGFDTRAAFEVVSQALSEVLNIGKPLSLADALVSGDAQPVDDLSHAHEPVLLRGSSGSSPPPVRAEAYAHINDLSLAAFVERKLCGSLSLVHAGRAVLAHVAGELWDHVWEPPLASAIFDLEAALEAYGEPAPVEVVLTLAEIAVDDGSSADALRLAKVRMIDFLTKLQGLVGRGAGARADRSTRILAVREARYAWLWARYLETVVGSCPLALPQYGRAREARASAGVDIMLPNCSRVGVISDDGIRSRLVGIALSRTVNRMEKLLADPKADPKDVHEVLASLADVVRNASVLDENTRLLAEQFEYVSAEEQLHVFHLMHIAAVRLRYVSVALWTALQALRILISLAKAASPLAAASVEELCSNILVLLEGEGAPVPPPESLALAVRLGVDDGQLASDLAQLVLTALALMMATDKLPVSADVPFLVLHALCSGYGQANDEAALSGARLTVLQVGRLFLRSHNECQIDSARLLRLHVEQIMAIREQRQLAADRDESGDASDDELASEWSDERLGNELADTLFCLFKEDLLDSTYGKEHAHDSCSPLPLATLADINLLFHAIHADVKDAGAVLRGEAATELNYDVLLLYETLVKMQDAAAAPDSPTQFEPASYPLLATELPVLAARSQLRVVKAELRQVDCGDMDDDGLGENIQELLDVAQFAERGMLAADMLGSSKQLLPDLRLRALTVSAEAFNMIYSVAHSLVVTQDKAVHAVAAADAYRRGQAAFTKAADAPKVVTWSAADDARLCIDAGRLHFAELETHMRQLAGTKPSRRALKRARLLAKRALAAYRKALKMQPDSGSSAVRIRWLALVRIGEIRRLLVEHARELGAPRTKVRGWARDGLQAFQDALAIVPLRDRKFRTAVADAFFGVHALRLALFGELDLFTNVWYDREAIQRGGELWTAAPTGGVEPRDVRANALAALSGIRGHAVLDKYYHRGAYVVAKAALAAGQHDVAYEEFKVIVNSKQTGRLKIWMHTMGEEVNGKRAHVHALTKVAYVKLWLRILAKSCRPREAATFIQAIADKLMYQTAIKTALPLLADAVLESLQQPLASIQHKLSESELLAAAGVFAAVADKLKLKLDVVDACLEAAFRAVRRADNEPLDDGEHPLRIDMLSRAKRALTS
ncbi:uncharacterized protein AMSG_05946 [Thecamonas trahens ATCC 50062]|uniref:Uncharacterized protein n=1 Tax=Thecamonas trahens ATCC 50062 TaxID=461836 RepID=A0A0L0DBT0_THETB|nr:hypothetical protein AMSG_05946 [Thecamonas trahens ATCC 50062]KNC49685.1 hypothetical protein AMSG_05946 [Thecamonas trahens ATCC 50062]|eukprot:XP_013757481.1 hypothetical protein AMSG_05946 [Thecamonas trahens ATCC 50062]